MNQEDISVVRSERAASPQRFREFDPTNAFARHHMPPEEQELRGEQPKEEREEAEEVEELQRANSPRESIESVESVEYQDIAAGGHPGLRRTQTETERINKLENHPTALERIETHRSQHSTTVGSSIRSRTKSKKDKPLPNFGAGKPYPPRLPEQEEYVVEFDGPQDPMHAQNWSMNKKLFIGAIVAFFSLSATFGSSVFSNAQSVVARHFHVGSEVGTLATSLYVLGYAFGPIIWAPFSELYGRRFPILVGSFGFGLFSIAVAVGKDLQTILICRFFGGLFGSCPLAVVAAIFSDMFDNRSRGLAIAVFSATVFMGPLLAPFIGGFIVTSYLGWRWTEYITAIMGFTSFVLSALFQEETYPPVILVRKASELRRRTKNWGIHAKQEEVEVDFVELVTKNVSRPLRILFTEPIVLLVSLYMSFIYGLLYLFLTAYALVFQGVYHMSPGVGGLPYFGMVIGEILAFITVVFMNKGYIKKLEANHGVPVPEWRLPLVIVASVSFTVGLFWFGWTGFTPKIHWIVPTVSGLATGFGIFGIFLQLLNYIVDSYLMFAASAIAGNTFLRSLTGCVFPLFATYMYEGMHIQYAQTLLGAVAAAAIPMPIIFLLFGKKIRGRSKMAPAPDLMMERKRDLESSGASSDDSNGGDKDEKDENSEKVA